MESFLKAVRSAASAQVWSQGVRLVRDDAVTGESIDATEAVLRVKMPGRAVAPTVVLYLQDEEWECDCPTSNDTCSHVVAAALSLSRSREGGTNNMPVSQASGGRVLYRFRREDGGLALERVLVKGDGTEELLTVTLAAYMSSGGKVSPEQADLNVDRILGARTRGALPTDRLGNVLTVLADHPRVELDGAAVSVSPDVLAPHAVVADHGGGARVIVDRDPSITEVVAFGVALAGKTVHRLGEIQLSGGKLELLPLVRDFAADQIAELKTRFLPDLARRIPVTTQANRLPEVVRDMVPRIEFKLEQTHDEHGYRLSVLSTLVYGDRPNARIDGDRLVHLGGPVPVRDETAEKLLRQRLRTELSLTPGQLVLFEGSDALAFMHKLKAYRGEGRRRGRDGADAILAAPELIPTIELRGDDLEVRFELPGEAGGGRADTATVLRAWRDGLGMVLVDGTWANLPGDWLERYGARIADLIAAKGERDTLPPFALPDLARLCADLDHPPPPGLLALRPLFAEFTALPEAPLPADLTAELRPYQLRGVSWLGFLRSTGLGGVLADDMGLGKTLQALCAVRGKTLVVCPTSVIYNWMAEIQRFRPGLCASVYHGPKRALDPAADITLTTYALLRIDIDLLSSQRWDTVILDEAQAIKNPDSQVARAAYRLGGEFRMTLSGTPVENRLDELWSHFHFTNRGLLGGRQHFRERYAEPIARGEAGAAADLRARIRPFLLRRMKQEVAPELPPRTDMIMHVELDERERSVYEAIRAATHESVMARLAEGGSVLAALEALLRLRQAACHSSLVPGQSADTSSKLEALAEALELVVAEGHKALVFSQWTSLLDLIAPRLDTAGIPWIRLDGSTRDRAGVVKNFQDPAGPPVILISLKAGGTGLNLTAADHVFLCDPWWNPAVENQAADRAHRIGQDRPVMVYRLVSKDTVEERIMVLQDKKRALIDVALGDAGAAAALTRDDLLALLE